MEVHAEPAPTPGEIFFVRYGNVRAHAVSRDEALELIALRALGGEGGFVLTPNLEHVARSQTNREIADACQRSFLCLADGAPLVYLSRLLRLPVREKVSGSDLFEPLMGRCAREGLPVFFLGATAEACETASRRLRARFPSLRVAGYDSSIFDLDRDPEQAATALRRARDCGARVIVGCLPTAKVLMLHRFEGGVSARGRIGPGERSRILRGRRTACPGVGLPEWGSSGCIGSRESPAGSGAGTWSTTGRRYRWSDEWFWIGFGARTSPVRCPSTRGRAERMRDPRSRQRHRLAEADGTTDGEPIPR